MTEATHDGRAATRRPAEQVPRYAELLRHVEEHVASLCVAAADVVLTNQHAESDLVDEPTRIRLVRTSADYHAAIVRELAARQALLAAELVLAPPAEAGARIEALCTRRDRDVHRCAPNAGGCVASLPYQRCAAGLVWFVATDGAP